MYRYACSTKHTPTVEIEARSEREAEMLYRQDFVQSRAIISVRYVGRALTDNFARFCN